MSDERVFTKRLERFFRPSRSKGIRVGIGDDAAVVDNPHANSVFCCDPVIEGVHFERGTDLRLVGRKSVNRNLSDLAAMGAAPDWLLVSLLLPEGMQKQDTDRLLQGIRAAARAGGAEVIGGDIANTPGPLTVTVTAIGHPGPNVLRRSAARAGDAIHLTGPVGGSDDGHHLRFRPALAEGAWLARQRGVGGCIDVSDGVLLDLATLLDASSRGKRQLGAELDLTSIRLRPSVGRRPTDMEAVRKALGQGEDHVLLFTVRPGQPLAGGGPLRKAARQPVGRVVKGPGLFLVEPDGTRHRVGAAGYQHKA